MIEDSQALLDKNKRQITDQTCANEQSVTEERIGLRDLLSGSSGIDLTSISVPITYNEPLSFLQRMREYLASKCEDPCLRMLYVSVFCITCYSGSDRKVKPFNPLLGETYEYVDEKKGLYFISEQVSHHPPVGALHCETDDWIYYQTQRVNTKFLGNSLDVTPTGTSVVVLKKYNERYSWQNIRIVVHNLIIGKVWIDHFGNLKILLQDNTSEKELSLHSHLKFKRCGWFGRNWNEIKGFVKKDKEKLIMISGKWNQEIDATALNGMTFKDDNMGICIGNKQNITGIWKEKRKKSTNPAYSKFEWSDYTVDLVKIDDEMLKYIPVTDSRLREDRFLLEKGKIKSASYKKKKFEEAQRMRKKTNSSYEPKYFALRSERKSEKEGACSNEEMWHFNGTYWKMRNERFEKNMKDNTQSSIKMATVYWAFEGCQTPSRSNSNICNNV